MTKIEKKSATPINGNLNFTKNFKRACEIIKSKNFEDYNISENWFFLFFDDEDRQWLIQEHQNKFYLTIDDEPVLFLGKLQEHISNFIEKITEERQNDIQAEKEYHQYRKELFRNYNYGII